MVTVVGQVDSSASSLLANPVTTLTVLAAGLTLLGLLVRSFLHKETGWEKIVESRGEDAAIARADAEAARAEAAAARVEAQHAMLDAAAARAEAVECDKARQRMEAEIAALRRRLDRVDRPWDGTERRHRPRPEGDHQ